MEQHNEQIRARITGTGNLLREIFACLFPVLGTLYAFSHAAVVLYLCAGVTGGYLPFGTCVPQPMWILLYFLAALGSSYLSAGRFLFLNADKHSPASSARSTKRRVRGGCLCQWELKAPTDRSRSDCVHEQVAKRIANVRFTPIEKLWSKVKAFLRKFKARTLDALPNAIQCAFQAVSPSDCSGWFKSCDYLH